jgi:hypothetical protein
MIKSRTATEKCWEERVFIDFILKGYRNIGHKLNCADKRQGNAMKKLKTYLRVC